MNFTHCIDNSSRVRICNVQNTACELGPTTKAMDNALNYQHQTTDECDVFLSYFLGVFYVLLSVAQF